MFKQSNKTLTMEGFGGIGAKVGGGRITDVVNFRIRRDGALEKRCGYRCIADVGSEIRAFYSGLFTGSFRMLLLAGDTVYEAHLASGTLTPLCAIESHEGSACFFCLGGTLYLMDGRTLYVIRDGEAVPAAGYAPLLGKDWPCTVLGEIHEPRNLLTRHARISYVVGSPASAMLCTKYAVESVEAVYLNGSRLDADKYRIDALLNTVNIPGLVEGDRVLIYLTFAEEESALRDAFLSCTDAVLFGGVNRSRLFFRGGSMPSMMFCSANTDEESLRESARHYSDVGALYIPEGYEFTVGDGRYLMRGVVPYRDRLLIFTEGDTWMAKNNASGLEEFPIVGVHSELGCASSDGAVTAQNRVLTVGRHGILQWEDATGYADGCRVESISAPVEAFFKGTVCSDWGLFYHEAERLLLCYHRKNGNVLLYETDRGEWYRYTGIVADAFFDADGTIGFRQGGKIFVLDPALAEDISPDGESLPIHAEYAGERVDFESERRKLLAGISLCGGFGEKIGEWEIAEDGRRVSTYSLRCDEPSSYGIVHRRIPSGRFRHVSFRLRSQEECRPVFYRLSLHLR